MTSTTDLHDIFFLLMAAVSTGVASSENASPMPTRLHQKTGFGISEPQIPKFKCRLDQTYSARPGLIRPGRREDRGQRCRCTVSMNLALCCQVSKAPQKFGNTSQKAACQDARSKLCGRTADIQTQPSWGSLFHPLQPTLHVLFFVAPSRSGATCHKTNASRTEKRAGRFRLAYPSETAQRCI